MPLEITISSSPAKPLTANLLNNEEMKFPWNDICTETWNFDQNISGNNEMVLFYNYLDLTKIKVLTLLITNKIGLLGN